MKIPGFSATSSLYRTTNSYVGGSSADLAAASALAPAGISDAPFPWGFPPSWFQRARCLFLGKEFCPGFECCSAGQTCCPGAGCLDLHGDSNNCGGCGNKCQVGGFCFNGVCKCPPGLTDCGGICADLVNDGFHCGGCNVLCSLSDECFDGSCIPRDNNCACGRVKPGIKCGDWETCVGGTCFPCQGWIECGGRKEGCPCDHKCRDGQCFKC